MNAVVAFALKHRVLMVVLFVMMLAGGIMAFRELNIEAYPDPTPPMVDVITQSPGLSAEEIERYITIPIEGKGTGKVSNASLAILREEIVPNTVGALPDAEAGVTGLTAQWKDGEEEMKSNLPPVIAFVSSLIFTAFNMLSWCQSGSFGAKSASG